MRLQTEHTDHTRFTVSHGIDLSRIAHPFGNQLSATLFWHGNILFFKCFVVDIREVHIIELHAAKFFQLFFNAAAHLKRKSQNFLQLPLCEFAVGVEQFQETANYFANSNRVSLVQIFPETIVPI